MEGGEKLNVSDENMLRALKSSKRIRAELLTTQDSNISNAIKRIASEKNVTQIIIGRPDRRFFKDLLTQGTLLY